MSDIRGYRWSVGEPPAMSCEAARLLAERLEKDGPEIRTAKELKLIVAALRYYGNSR